MTTVKATSVLIKSADTKGSGAVEFEVGTYKQLGVIKVTWNGGTLAFSTYAEYLTFFTEVAGPLMNVLNSTSGTGTDYEAVINGIAGSDKVTN